MLKALIFDFDGTIANTLPACFNAFKRTVEPVLGKEMSLPEIRSYFGPTEEGIFAKHFPDRQHELAEIYYKIYAEEQAKIPNLVPGVMDVIREVKAHGIRVALITAKGPVSCKISLDFYKIADDFEEVRTGGPNGRVKDVAIREILEIMGVGTDDVAYVGDSWKDVISSHKAGVPSWAAAWLDTAEPERILSYNPEKIFYTVGEFRRTLQEEGILE